MLSSIHPPLEIKISSMVQKIILLVIVSTTATLTNGDKSKLRVKRGGLLFPPASGMGVFLALAVPVDLPQYELSLSYNFEANYLLPDNATELELGPQITQVRYARSLTRTRVYDVIQQRLESEGYVGKSCLLRAICETSAQPVEEHNGLLGELIHLVFTPSTSAKEDLPRDFWEAEEIGQQGREQCEITYKECTLDLYELFSIWENY